MAKEEEYRLIDIDPEYRITVLQKQENSTWIVLGTCTAIPGGCRPHMIFPIVGVANGKGEVERIRRSRARGWLDPQEAYAYLKWWYYERDFQLNATAKDGISVELNGDVVVKK